MISGEGWQHIAPCTSSSDRRCRLDDRNGQTPTFPPLPPPAEHYHCNMTNSPGRDLAGPHQVPRVHQGLVGRPLLPPRRLVSCTSPTALTCSTPVCTTELSAVALSSADFASRGVKLIGLSANDVSSHHGWIKDIGELLPEPLQLTADALTNSPLEFPIVADKDRKISVLYDMLDHQDATNVDAKGLPFTVRSVFIIDPQQKIRLTLTYPASTGRNFPEILRVIDSLQLGDKYKITTPANWRVGGGDDKVIIHPSVQGEKVKELFGDDVETVYVSIPQLCALSRVADPSPTSASPLTLPRRRPSNRNRSIKRRRA